MTIAPDLKPFFEFALINCFAVCSFCGMEQEFESAAISCSDAWYLDMAVSIQRAKWAIPKKQVAACPACTASRGLKHDPNAFTASD
jgi:hypothetical protein